ncbi:PEP-CTERM sorting domain-containing protein [Pseudoduganella sp.]|uniref:PEP-CTERM sorting domain-containing protein n=1 Tax=Pseudoduganella sp. TaxID=1880898 RepID=UPI0035AEAC00
MVSNKFLAGIAALVISVCAQAAPVSLTSNVSASGQLSQSQGKWFDFNVNSLLGGKSLDSNSILSGVLTVSAYSKAALVYDGFTFDGRETTTVTRPKPGNCNNVNCSVVDVTKTDYYTYKYKDDVADTMWILAGNTWAYDMADLQTSTSAYERDANPWYKSGNDRQGWTKYYDSERTSQTSYSGNLSVSMALDAKALADLTKDGILSFYVYDAWGKFDLNGFKLDLLAQQLSTPADGKAPASVPVPTSLLLTGLGLAALATMRRRKA